MLRDHQGCLGGLVRLPNEPLVELMGRTGFQFVLFDLEHGPGDHLSLYRHLLAAEAVGLTTLVRLAGVQPEEVQRVLDLGAQGILVPHVTSAHQARQIVDAAHYPPLGRRGVSRFTRAGQYGLVDAETHLRSSAASTTVLVMLEDRAGCSAATEILAVDGIDGVMVGPADLALSSAHDTEAPPSPGQLQELTDEVYREAVRAGLGTMEIVSDAAEAAAAVERERNLVVFNVQALVTAALVEATAHLPAPRRSGADG